MAVTADSVVVELLAKTDGYTPAINGAAAATQTSMSKIEKSAAQAEAQVQKSAAGMGAAFNRAANDIDRGAIRAANGTRNLGRQVADIGVGLSTGQNPFFILAQQAPQVADALADTGGRAASVAAFFAGPWAAALLAAGSALGILVGKALEAGDSLESLVEQLQASAEKTRLTAEAQRIFEGTADGAADAIDKMNEALGKANITQEQAIRLDLARARSLREVALRALTAAEASARQAISESNISGLGTNATGSAGAVSAAIAGAVTRRATAERVLADAQRSRAAAEKAVANAAIPLLDSQAAAATDKSTAATLRHEKALGKLRDAYLSASRAATTNAQREAATRQYRESRTRIDGRLASEQEAIRESDKKGPRGPSAETLAKRAEAARVQEVRNNEAYNNELEQLNRQIIAARRAQTADADRLADFDREAVASELRKRLDGIAADESARKYDRTQADLLRQRAQEAARQQNQVIDNTVAEARAQEINALALTDLRNQQEQAQANLTIADTIKQRRALELELLKLKYDQLRTEQQRALDQALNRDDPNGVALARANLAALPDRQRAEETAVGQRYEGAYDRFRKNLTSEDGIQASLDRVKIDSLEAVTDELTNATTAALGLKGAFGQIVGELIRIGIQRAIIGPLADSLFGAAGGGGAGGFLGSLFGRASGGFVPAGQMVRVNEGASGGRVEGWRPAGSGTVIPLGQMGAAQPTSSTTVLQTVSVDARGAVMNDQFARLILDRAGQDARQIVGANNVATRKALPGAQARFGALGTTG